MHCQMMFFFTELKSAGLDDLKSDARIVRYIYKRGLGEDLFGVIRAVAIRTGLNPSLLGLFCISALLRFLFWPTPSYSYKHQRWHE